MRDLSIEGRATVAAAVEALGLGEGRLTRRQLATLTSSVAGRDDLWLPVVRRDFEHRWYIRLHWSRHVEVWLLGWQPGQDTSFHDHGGSSGAFVVTDGSLVERYGSVERWAGGGRRRVHRPGAPCAFGPGYVHNLGNASSRVATSVHVYSPPLSTMTYYRADAAVLVPYQTLMTSGPEPNLDMDQATSSQGVAVPAPT